MLLLTSDVMRSRDHSFLRRERDYEYSNDNTSPDKLLKVRMLTLTSNARLAASSLLPLRRPAASIKLIPPLCRSGSSDHQQTGTPTSSDKRQNLRKEVIDLYKNLIYLSREWPTDLRPQIRRGFVKNKDVQDPDEIRKLLARGEYISREITATYHLRKYRAMKRRYYSDTREKELDEMFKNFSQ